MLLRFAICFAALLSLGQSSRAQLGTTRQQLVAQFGSCQRETGRAPSGPNVYDSVIDVGTHCYFSYGAFRVMALFKSDRVVGLTFTKEPTFWDSFFHPFRYTYLPLSVAEISACLHAADATSEWIAQPSDDTVRRWRTANGSATAYYFAGGNNELYNLIVQTAAVDEIYRRVEHY
jgi:hypothetical protein